jgi:hypothetical protein
MSSLFAPPEIMSAYAFAVDGSDKDLPKGTHLRIFAGLGASFPLAPFAAFKVRSRASEPHGLHVTDRAGTMQPGVNLVSQHVANVTLILDDSDTQRTVRVDMHPDDDNKLERATLLDQTERVIAERSAPQWMFSAPVLHKLQLIGRTASLSILTRRVDVTDVSGRETLSSPAGVFGLPIRGAFPWYVGTLDRDLCMKQVERGAPRHLNPMDQPSGPLSPVGPADEIARVSALLASPQPDGGIEAMVSRLVRDDTPPWLQADKHQQQPDAAATRYSNTPRLGTLQLAALDVGIARFLGFAGTVDDLPDYLEHTPWDCLAILGTFAIDPGFFGSRGARAQDLLAPAPNETSLLDAQILALGNGNRDDRIVRGLTDSIARAKRLGLLVRSLVAVVAPVPPWLPPSLPKPQVNEVRWQKGDAVSPSSRYRAGFAFSQPPLAFLCAVAQQTNGTWQSRHGFIDVGAHVPHERAMPRVLGYEVEPLSRLRLYSGGAGSIVSAGLVSDQDINSDAGQIRYRFAASDCFGRFGPSIEALLEPPPRPAPPPPVLRFYVETSAVDSNSTAKLSPGLLHLTFAVSHPPPAEKFAISEQVALASAILVPALDDLPAGALRIKRVEVNFDAQNLSIDLLAAGLTSKSFTLRELAPQEKQTLDLSAAFFDEANTPSTAARVGVSFTDPRPPKVYPTGLGLFWTSAPGPAGEVELKLTWPAARDSLHRVYLTDQQGLGLTASDLNAPGSPANLEPSKGRVAEVGAQKVLDGGAINRDAFRLLTDPPVKAGSDGRAIVDIRLPRSLSTVQFLRVVPLTSDGLEAPFDQCGIVPVAVPDSRRPVAPRLDGSVDPVTGVATLTISTTAFDRGRLARDEPGLFSPSSPGKEAPQFRLRRAAGAVPDPIYAREIAHGTLTLTTSDPTTTFSSTVQDNAGRTGLTPFVRYAYWAEVRLPPERNLPAGVAPIAPPGGISALDPASAGGHPCPMSLPSAARVVMRVPPNPPAALAATAVTAVRHVGGDSVTVDVTVADPPRAHAKAVAKFRLAAWAQWSGQPIEPIRKVNGADLAGAFPELGTSPLSLAFEVPMGVDPAGPLKLRLAVVDPVNRMSSLVTIDVP